MKLFNISLYKYIFFVFFVGLLVATAQTSLLNDFTQKGPSAAYAEGDDFGQPGFDGYPEPGFEGEEALTPVNQPTAPVSETPAVNTPAAPAAPAAPSCSDDLRYCDPNVGKNIHKTGGVFRPGDPSADSQGCVYAFVEEDACGQPAPAPQAPAAPPAAPVAPAAPATPPAPTQVCVPNAFNPNTCARCAGDGTWEGTPGSDFGPSNGSAAWCGCAAKYNQSAYNQYCQVAAPAAPAAPAPAPAAPTQQANPNIPQCNGTIQVENGVVVCVNQTNTQQVEARGGSAIANATITNSGNSSVRTEVTREIIREVPVVANQPIAIQVASVVCPANTTKKVVDQKIVCEVNRQAVVLAGVSEAKELPKTGLPLAAWAIGAFIPAGLKLRRFNKGLSQNYGDWPKFIWEERQFKI